MEPIRLPIRQVSHTARTDLSLEGTVLVMCERQGGMQAEVQIPVELISIWERARFKGTRLIWALFVLFLSLVAMGLLGALFGVTDSNRQLSLFVPVAFVVLMLGGCLAFCILLLRFFFRAPTVCLVVAPSEQMIEFWWEPKDSERIDTLLEQIEHRQKLVEETFATPVKSPVASVDEPSLWRKLLAFFYAACIPAVIAGDMRLLMLTVLPIVWFLYRQAQYRRLPTEYRRAFRHYLKRNWAGAVESLQNLLRTYPDYIPAYALLAHVYTRWGRFDDALGVVSQLGEDWAELAQDMQTQIWRFKRMAERRGEPVPSDAGTEAHPGEGEP